MDSSEFARRQGRQRTGESNVKGIMFLSAVDRVRQLLDAGQLQPDRVAEVLNSEDLKYLKEPVVPTLWYAIGTCKRYIELLWEVEGEWRADYLRQRGAAAAERIFREGTYAKLMETAKSWGGNQIARALILVTVQFYDFTRWELVGNFYDDEYAVEVHDAAEWPDVMRIGSEGFIEVLHSRARGRALSVTSERPAPDRVVFRIAVRR